MIQQITKAIDGNKSIPKVNALDAMKILTVCWEDVTEERVKKCYTKSSISPKDQANAQNYLDDPYTELRYNMGKLKSLGIDEIPEELTREKFPNFDDTVAATEPILSDELVLAMVREVEEPVEVESDKEDGDDTIEVYDKCLENPTSIELRNAIETLMDFSFSWNQKRCNATRWKF